MSSLRVSVFPVLSRKHARHSLRDPLPGLVNQANSVDEINRTRGGAVSLILMLGLAIRAVIQARASTAVVLRIYLLTILFPVGFAQTPDTNSTEVPFAILRRTVSCAAFMRAILETELPTEG